MDQVGRLGAGYLYYVSLKGVTGAGHLDTDDVARKVAIVRQHTSLPIGVGFGISDAESARAVAAHADAVVIGSAIIKLMEQQVAQQKPVVPAVTTFLSGIRLAIDQNN
jgi:tryptophan synthase alpha chain